MEALLNDDPLEMANGQHWGRMLVGSIFLHLAIFAIVFLIPGSLPTRRVNGTVYEVTLVEAPSRTVARGRSGPAARKGKPISRKRRLKPAKRVGRLTRKEKAVVLAKRTVKKRRATRIKPKHSPARLLEKAISKIERKVKTREKDTVQEAVSRIESKRKQGSAPSGKRAGAQSGIAIQLYKLEVENRIKENWGYPAAFIDPEKARELEASVIVKVSSDGSILKSWFEKASGNPGFDESVRKAIERSNPLPPFPEGYLKTYEEIEITFNLKELE